MTVKCCKKGRAAEARRRKIRKLEDKRGRLSLYLDRERTILEGGVKAYGIGSRNITRYESDLANVRAAIKSLEDEIDALEAELCCGSARGAVAAVARHW